MSKSDKLTIAVAAILSGLGFVVGGPVWGFGLLIFGLIYLVAFWHHQPEPTLSLGSIIPPSRELAAPTVPNIKCVAVRSASVVLDPYVARENDRGLFSFYALLRNDPLSPNPLYISGLKAHISVLENGKEICSGYGTWLNHIQNVSSLAVGDEIKLLLAVLTPEKAEVYTVTNSRSLPLPTRTRARMNALSQASIRPHLLMGDNLTISVTLIDRRGARHGIFDFGYAWKDGNVQITKL